MEFQIGCMRVSLIVVQVDSCCLDLILLILPELSLEAKFERYTTTISACDTFITNKLHVISQRFLKLQFHNFPANLFALDIQIPFNPLVCANKSFNITQISEAFSQKTSKATPSNLISHASFSLIHRSTENHNITRRESEL
jgi:hypothetical protein